jgi:hypothetical protein
MSLSIRTGNDGRQRPPRIRLFSVVLKLGHVISFQRMASALASMQDDPAPNLTSRSPSLPAKRLRSLFDSCTLVSPPFSAFDYRRPLHLFLVRVSFHFKHPSRSLSPRGGIDVRWSYSRTLVGSLKPHNSRRFPPLPPFFTFTSDFFMGISFHRISRWTIE